MLLWMTLLVMETMEAAMMVRTFVVIATTLSTMKMVMVTMLLEEVLTSVLALQLVIGTHMIFWIFCGLIVFDKLRLSDVWEIVKLCM
jgi:hypothetical protein